MQTDDTQANSGEISRIEIIDLLKERSLFSLGVSENDVINVLDNSSMIDGVEGQLLASEGESADHFYIPLSGSVELYSSSQSSDGKVGEVNPGRLVDTYSTVRWLPYQYTLKVGKSGQVLSIPCQILRGLFRKYPLLQSYLVAVTGSVELRRISKEIEASGCSKPFMMNLTCSISCEAKRGQLWLQKQNEQPSTTFLVLKGEVQAFKTAEHKLKGLWMVPQRVWISWTEVAKGQTNQLSFRSVSDCEIASVNTLQLRSLQLEFPDDFEKFSTRVSSGFSTSSATGADESQEDEILSIEELFKDTVQTKRRPFSKYPWVQQHDQMDCGPACMAMISKFHGRAVSIQQWRARLSTNREGTSLFDLATIGDAMGFSCHGLSIPDVESIDRNLLPCIILRTYHYMVLYKVEKNHVVVGDPGVGIRRIPKKDFYQGFTPVALFLKPTPTFFDQPEYVSKYRHYIHLFDGVGFEFLLAIVCSCLFVVVSLFPPFLNQFIFDEVLSKKELGLLGKVLIGGIIVAALDAFMTWARTYYTEYIAAKVDFKAKSAFLKKTMTLPYHYFSVRHVGDFTRRMQELESVRRFMTTGVFGLVLSLVSIFIYFGVILVYSPKLALVVLLLVPGFLIISLFFTKRLQSLSSELFVNYANQDGLLADLIKGIGAIKSSGAEMAARWRYEERLAETIKNRYKLALTGASLNGVIEGYLQFAKLTVLGVSAYLAMTGELSIGQVIAISMISGQILTPFFNVATLWPQFQETKMILNRLNDVFLSPSESKKVSTTFRPAELKGEIEFRDVWFRYGGESTDWTLRGVSFKIEARQHVAIVGPSGSGKSTIAYLLTRMYEPTKGQIFIDGRDYREYDLGWLRSQLGLLLQESNLFQGTIEENIAFGTPEPSAEDAAAAARMSAADDFISKKPGGYDYVLTHGGIGLSGGEKQRIALARTLYTKPTILILDEATSALDGISETILLQNLKAEKRIGTVVSIAHRYSTVAASEFVLVLQSGQVVGYGTKDELRNNHPLYQGLFGFTQPAPAAVRQVA